MHTRFRSRFFRSGRNVLVYLPPGYDWDLDRRYPVLYMQDGQNLFDAATSQVSGREWRMDEAAEWMIQHGELAPLMIVGIYHGEAKRNEEYTPTRDPRSNKGGLADRYGRMIVEELKPFIDSSYRTLPGSWDTGLGGSSLGGLVSLHVGLNYPDVFGKLAVLSPSVWWDNRFIIQRVYDLPGKTNTRIWLDMGTAEGSNSSRYLQDTRDLRDALICKGWREGDDLRYVEVAGGNHSEDAWADRIGTTMQYLFPR